MDATYNMMYFYDCLDTLNTILVAGMSDVTGEIIDAFDRECINKLEILIDIIANDIR